MNPRQRRGVLFLLLSALGAITVFALTVSYVSSVNAKVAPVVTVYRASASIPAYGEITPAMVKAVEVPERWVPPSAVRDLDDLTGRRVAYTVAAGTYLGQDVLLPESALNRDEREIAIDVDAVTGIAGRLSSGDLVDVYAVFGDREAGSSQVLVRNVRVVSVGGVQTRSQETAQGALADREVVPVTLALRPDDALKVTYADAFATSVRLVGLPPGIQSQDRRTEPSTVDTTALGLAARPEAEARPR